MYILIQILATYATPSTQFKYITTAKIINAIGDTILNFFNILKFEIYLVSINQL